MPKSMHTVIAYLDCLLAHMQVLVFHSLAFVVGYAMTRAANVEADSIATSRCISLETGMQVIVHLCCVG